MKGARWQKSVYDKNPLSKVWRARRNAFLSRKTIGKTEREREREKRGDPMEGIIRHGNECIFFGEITAVFQQLSEPFLRADKWRPWSPIPAKTVRFASVRTQTGWGRQTGPSHADITRPEELFSTGLMVSELESSVYHRWWSNLNLT